MKVTQESVIATLFCALRTFQRTRRVCGDCTHFNGIEALGNDEIDDLIERLNFGRTLLVELPDGFGPDDAAALLDWVRQQSPSDDDAADSVACQRSFMEYVLGTMQSKPTVKRPRPRIAGIFE